MTLMSVYEMPLDKSLGENTDALAAMIVETPQEHNIRFKQLDRYYTIWAYN